MKPTRQFWSIGALVVAALGVLAGLVWLSGVSPGDAVVGLFRGSLGSPNAINGTIRETTPLLIAGIAVFIALRAGLFNIGVEGQLLMGACASAAVALAVPGGFGMVLAIVAGVGAGAVWALPAGLIKAYRGGHEVITTIMLNAVALNVTAALVAGPMKGPGEQAPTTANLSPSSMLPVLWQSGPLRLSLAVVLALAVLFAFAFWYRRYVAAYELRLTGANPEAARFAGVRTSRVQASAMTLSGAVGGLAGAVQVLGYEGRFYANFSPGYGFDALGVAILAGSTPLGLIPSALFFGILNQGSTRLQILGIPKGITWIVLAMLIIIFATVRYRRSQSHD